MKVLMIGGTGRISAAVSARAVAKGIDLYLLNRGTRDEFFPEGAKHIAADASDEEGLRAALKGMTFDAVVDWIGFLPEQAEKDIRVFADITKQFIYISSASAYEKPPGSFRTTEDTPLVNPFWQYSRDKIESERIFFDAYAKSGFPITVVRPSHTYGTTSLPMIFPGRKSPYSVIERMKAGKPIIVPGDGTSIWVVTHNTDFAKAFVALLGNEKAIGEAYHITDDTARTWDDIVLTIGRAAGLSPTLYHMSTDFLTACHPAVRPELVGDKINSVSFDNSKVKSLAPEFICTTDLEAGAKMTLDWFDRHPSQKLRDDDWENLCDRLIAAHEAGIKAFG